MELRHLRYFVAVAEELHFRRAAERLHMSQPPLSQQIRALEEELGVQLLVRDRRGVVLTDAGRRFLGDARDILAAADGAAETARRVARGEVGELAVGFVGSAMYGSVPDLLREFRSGRPDVGMVLRELTTPAQVEALHDRRIDVGFLRPPIDADGLVLETIVEESLVVVLRQDHRLARYTQIDPRVLDGTDFIAPSIEEAPGMAGAINRTLGQAGAVPRVVQSVAEMPTAVGLVAAGVGVTIVPRSLASLRRPDVVYRPLAGGGATVSLALASRDGDRSPVVAAFVESVRG